MANSKVFYSICVVFVIMCFVSADANPLYRLLQRQKRVSDQRLAELETIIALSNMKGKLVTVPVGFGRVDPTKLGRRRRSAAKLLQSLINDNSSELENTVEDSEEDQQESSKSDENVLLNLLYEKLSNKYRTIPIE